MVTRMAKIFINVLNEPIICTRQLILKKMAFSWEPAILEYDIRKYNNIKGSVFGHVFSTS